MRKKKLSQNFLINRDVARDIVDLLDLKPHDYVIEIGPGDGALTSFLIEKTKNFLAVEYDHYYVNVLKKKFTNIKIIHKNILDYDFSKLNKKVKLIGNLPYHLSKEILLLVDKNYKYFDRCVFMLQKELVERIVACPGSAKRSRLTVTMGLRWDLRFKFNVPSKFFDPQPKVDSAIFEMKPHLKFQGMIKDFTKFDEMLKLLFSKKRKKIKNSVNDNVKQNFKFDYDKRVEDLTIPELIKLSDYF